MRGMFLAIVLAFGAMSLASLTIEGCNFGSRARHEVLAPAMAMASEGVRNDAMAGVDAMPEADQAVAKSQVDAFFAALSSDETRADSVALWPAVKALALSGIEAKLVAESIGPTVAGSLRERVRKFDDGMALLIGRQ